MSANPYYTHTSGLPATQTRAVSSQARAEFDSVATGFDGVYAEILALAAAIGVPTTVSEVPVASSSTTDIGNGYGPVVQITGTNPITSFGANYKGAIFIRFAGALVLTHSASLVCPGSANITTTAGDACIAIPIGNPGSGWRIAAYCRMSLGLVDDVAVRTSSTYADPAWLTALAWSKITGLPTTLAGYGITDAPTKTGAGASGSWDIDITGSASKLGGVAAGTYLQNQTPTAFTSAGTAPAYTLTPTPAIAALAANQRFRVKFHSATSGAATLAVNGLAATAIKQYDSTGAKVDPTIAASQLADVEYDGTHWVILDPLPPAANTSTQVTVRQTVMAGAATRIAIGTGLAVNLLATTTPVRVAFAAGMGVSGNVDYVGTLSADVASFWSGLTANVINYLFYDRNVTTGAITGVASTLPYIAQDSSVAISVVNGQHTYVYDTGQMYVGNGATATAVQRTAEGECLAGAASITSVTSYLKMGRYKQPWINTLPGAGVAVSVNHNIGTAELAVKLEVQSITAEFGFVAGDSLTEVNGNTGGVAAPISLYKTAKTLGFTVTNTGSMLVLNKTTGANAAMTLASWKYRLIAERNF